MNSRVGRVNRAYSSSTAQINVSVFFVFSRKVKKTLLEKKVLATEDICWFRSRLLMLSKVNLPYLIGQLVCHGLHETVRENLILKGYQTFRKEFVWRCGLYLYNCA